MLRWKRNAKIPKLERRTSFLSALELRMAELALFKLILLTHYRVELESLAKGLPVRSKSHLRRLASFICPKGLLPVGGRLHNTLISYNEAHSIIFPASNPLVKRMI